MGEESSMDSKIVDCDPLKNPTVTVTQSKIECLTPDKTLLTQRHHEEGQSQLPQDYKSLADLFHHMYCSLMLLNLRKRSTTFQNISTQVQVLAKRKFSYRHLAQMKFILPEAIKIDRVLVSDKETQCMRPDIHISLLFDIVQRHCGISDFTAMRKVFSSRLNNFFATHPEACDVPEAILLEPFSKSSQIPAPKELSTNASMETKPALIQTELLLEKVCPYPYISRHFSQNAVVAKTEKDQVLSSPASPSSADSMKNQGIENVVQKEFLDLSYISDSMMEQGVKNRLQKESCSNSSSIDHSVQLNNPQACTDLSVTESPVVKLTSSASSLLIETPAPLTPKRSIPSCDAKHETTNTQKSTSSYKPAKRVLDFSDLEGDKSALDPSADESDCYNIVKQNIPKTTEKRFEDRNISCSPASHKVEQIRGCSGEDCKKTQTSSLMCQQIPTRITNMVTLIYGVLKSCNWSSITKEELVHKTIMNSLDIIERKEVEEQIGLLERDVPDWINSKLLSSGDIMYTVNKVPNLDSILSKLKHLINIDQEREVSDTW